MKSIFFEGNSYTLTENSVFYQGTQKDNKEKTVLAFLQSNINKAPASG